MRALDAVRRQQAGIRHGLVEVFADRQRIPDAAPSCRKHGTRIVGEISRISARAEGSSGAIVFSSNGRPENLVISQPRSDQDE